MDFNITEDEKLYLRDLAKKQLELSNLTIMEERTKRWYSHNKGDTITPMIIFETKYCEDDLIDLSCKSEFARIIELEILRHIVNHNIVNDDKVVPNYFTMYWETYVQTLNLDMSEYYIDDTNGKSIGYTTIQHLKDLKESMHKIGKTKRSVDKDFTYKKKLAIEEIIGDILDVRLKIHPSFNWAVSPSKKAEYLMGLESMMYAPFDCPKEFNQLYQILVDDILETFDWMIEEDVLCLNNGNDYAGSGSYGFTDLLPTDEYKKINKITKKDLWVNLNSQETVGVSPEMYGEFYWPYYKQLAKEFGLVYYGCCEPTDSIFEKYLSTLDNLKKVSVSPWADINLMGQYLRGTNIVYSRKPSPNYIGIKNMPFDEDEYRKHIKESVRAASGCNLEIICRDVYALDGDRSKITKAVNIIKQTVDENWKK